MRNPDLRSSLDVEGAGREMYELARRLYPIPRSITGDGVRKTLEILREITPVETREVASGTPVFDWTVPREWNPREAWIEGPDGERMADFARHNLHLVGYSVPVHRKMSLAELQEHLHSLPQHPGWIPYRTSYYKETWGFCLPDELRRRLPEGEYEVKIDASLEDGHLSWGEIYLPGDVEEEVLVSCHVCHPALANDNLSGLAVGIFLARHLRRFRLRYSYRVLFVPGTIGAIAWLAANEERVHAIRAGLVAANLGDPGHFHYKRSRRGNAEIDRAVEHILRCSGEEYEIEDFVPFGYDERQYCSPAFNLAVGSLTRTPYGRYAEYHTSADNLDFIRPEHLGASLARYLEVVELLEHNRAYLNLNPRCEPQLGRRGLYRSLGGGGEGRERELALLWVLNLSDGEHALLAIAERAGLCFAAVRDAAWALRDAGLLQEVGESGELGLVK